RIDLDHGAIDFDFVDATNLRSPDALHVHGLEIRLIDADHLTLTFLFQSGSVKSREEINLKRSETRPSEKTHYDQAPSSRTQIFVKQGEVFLRPARYQSGH